MHIYGLSDSVLSLFAFVAVVTNATCPCSQDQRAPPPAGRIPDPSDILASVLVSESKIQANSYQPMPTYRLCTGDGICLLTDDSMKDVCKAIESILEADA